MFEIRYVQDEFAEKIKGRVVFPGVEFRNVFVVLSYMRVRESNLAGSGAACLMFDSFFCTK